jgi:Holliday junction resolvasome RuvABC endonuclease subunit
LAFAEGLACAVEAKANVPFAGWHKIELKKCVVGKIKNTKA